MKMESNYYVIVGKNIVEFSRDSCYPPNENNEIMVHTHKFSYEHYKLGKEIFESRKEAESKLKEKTNG